jgi:hypothetical protein
VSQDEPDDGRLFGTAIVQQTLGCSTDVDSCVALTKRINRLLSQALEHFSAEGGIACRAGCNFCCHLRVMVYPHEAIALFRYLGSSMPKEQADLVRQRLLVDGQPEGVVGSPCAFLVDGRCSAYEVRPSACSGYHSLSRERCEHAHEAGGSAPEGIPMSQAMRHVAETLNGGMQSGLRDAHLDTGLIELQSGVATLLRKPALIERWRSHGGWKDSGPRRGK